MSYEHQPVMVEEVVQMLDLKPGGTFIDCTAGGAGHILANLSRVGNTGKILGIDLDPDAIVAATQATAHARNQITIVSENYKNIKKIADVYKFNNVDGILLDLGLSSYQLQDRKRGFGFSQSAPLDMRFGPDGDVTAGHIIATYSKDQLIKLFREFGEEMLAPAIASAVVAYRSAAPIETTDTLKDIIEDVYHKRYRGKSRTHPATKVFQALRIAVNDELGNVTAVLPDAVSLLRPGGRLVVISYHSLEDRIVKNYFRTESRDCICPPEIPICQCGHKKIIKVITKKPLVPSDKEIASNARSRSAKMRVAEKLK